LRVDLHVHSIFSPDSLSRPEAIVRWGLLRGLGALAVTDHNTIAGALAVRQLAPFRVIVGSEIATARGEVIGLFLQQEIAAGLSLQETIRQIHDQGGLAYVPHPLDRVRHSAKGLDALLDVIAEVDLIEAINPASPSPWTTNSRSTAARYHVAREPAPTLTTWRDRPAPAWRCRPLTMRGLFGGAAPGQVYGDLSSPLVHLWTASAPGQAPPCLVGPERRTAVRPIPFNRASSRLCHSPSRLAAILPTVVYVG
jgi:hypothetical protein